MNEQILAISDGFALGDDLDLICECSYDGCCERLRLSRDSCDAIRRFPTRFVVRPGHHSRQEERVVEGSDGYFVVEALGTAAEFAIQFDPRKATDGR